MGRPAVSMRTLYMSISDSAVGGTARNSSNHREPITWQLACGKHSDAGVTAAVVAGCSAVKRMLRLHYADMHTWVERIQEAAVACNDARVRFVMYSASYGTLYVIIPGNEGHSPCSLTLAATAD